MSVNDEETAYAYDESEAVEINTNNGSASADLIDGRTRFNLKLLN